MQLSTWRGVSQQLTVLTARTVLREIKALTWGEREVGCYASATTPFHYRSVTVGWEGVNSDNCPISAVQSSGQLASQ